MKRLSELTTNELTALYAAYTRALFVGSAVNNSGIAHGLIDALAAITPECSGTEDRNGHVVTVLYLDAMAQNTGRYLEPCAGAAPMADVYAACKARSEFISQELNRRERAGDAALASAWLART